MSLLTREQFQANIKKLIGDDTSDDAIRLVEDMTETFDGLTNRAADTTNWEQKYNENDAAWRKKYRDAFFSPAPPIENPDPEVPGDPPKPKNFEDLFKDQ